MLMPATTYAGTGRLTLIPTDWVAFGQILLRSDFSTLLRSTGDGVNLVMTRVLGDPLDTCAGDIAVHYVDLIYETQ